MCTADEQQFCLRWNNFQANITSQFETLRDDEDFTDVTIACEGQRLQAHKIVLSACSPFFKELFKSNPCPHPIIFMRDVEAQHIVALMEFMYAGEVNVAQAQLSAFLKTAESLKIRGLTDTSSNLDCTKEENGLFLNPQPSSSKTLLHSNNKQVSTTKTQESSSSTVTSSQDFNFSLSPNRSPTSKRLCKNDRAYINSPIIRDLPKDDSINVNPFALQNDIRNYMSFEAFEPKVEMPDYLSDDETKEGKNRNCALTDMADLPAGMEIIPQNCSFSPKGNISGISQEYDRIIRRHRPSYNHWLPLSEKFNEELSIDTEYKELPPAGNEGEKRNRLVKLGEGVEIYEDQLRSVKWSDYRKLTRGLATILFSPAELATCSVTGQRWSRAGNGERPVKPALDRAKVQAIISYVANRFPMVEVSRIKQVLAYKCKENSTAFKMKAVRYFGDQQSNLQGT
ncbi:uncharacterized protein LOC108744368 isoform X2 [Agrilus planipennis]|uniref:Uncharacterized protein LOC108744368 isoform X2 n=1 Tax=Agrilus planipennis TaxID=224129 RepID=A0A1W4XT36_AGRPL|nr:uncharacterized protein LOC108744368 isoform X2 [Agrilus planipennis]